MADYEHERASAHASSSNGGNGGVIAILVVIVVLLVAGFLYFTQYQETDEGPDIELTVPAPDVNLPDTM